MPTRLTLELPESALKRLLEGIRTGDPTLKVMLVDEFGVTAIQVHGSGGIQVSEVSSTEECPLEPFEVDGDVAGK